MEPAQVLHVLAKEDRLKRNFTQKAIYGDFPGSPVVKTSPSNARDAGSILSYGAKIPHASWPKKKNKPP